MGDISLYIERLITDENGLGSHCNDVSNLAVEFGSYLGYKESEVKLLKHCGLVHDIGKLMVPNEILYKKGQLTEDEFEYIKMHPVFGYKLLKETGMSISPEILRVVLEHHERIDGRGYPYQIASDEISTFSKIISLCDVYSVIRTKRVYKEVQTHEYAVEEIKNGLGTQFDEELGREFIGFLRQREIEPVLM